MPTFKYYNGSAWVGLAEKSDVKKYYTHNIRITVVSNHINFTLTTSDSSTYNRSTLADKLSVMTNNWTRPLPLNGYVYDDSWEFCFPLVLVERIGSGKASSFRFTYLGGNGEPAHIDVPTLTFIMNDIKSDA